MKYSVVIDCFPESVRRYRRGYAIVAVDVIRATTTIATAIAMGRKCFPVPTLEAAHQVSARLRNPLLAGEVGGVIAPGFEINNSPAELAMRNDISRPLVLLSSSGTKLVHMVRATKAAYIACFRNFEFLANSLVGRHSRIAIIGAGSRGEFRQEDQMCCAWIAEHLIDSGYFTANKETAAIVERWRRMSPSAILSSPSAKYLMRSGQRKDLDFILAHIADLDWEFTIQGDEVVGHTPSDDDFDESLRPSSDSRMHPSMQG